MNRTALLATALVLISACRPSTPRVRVACVGDSITEGREIADVSSRYPAQLARLLGPGHEVRNFGVGGATLLASGDRPYTREGAFRESLAFRPDVVVIALGTNDAKPWNWEGRRRFVADAVELVNAFRRAVPGVRVLLCLPPPVFGPGAFGIPGNVVRDEVTPLLEQASREAGVETIDLHGPLAHEPELFPDRVHPSGRGARIIAESVARAISRR